MTPNGILTTLYVFSAGSDGYQPNGVIQATDGSFWGTTRMGGANNGQGTVFRFGVVPAGTLQFSSAAYNVNEGAGVATITVSRANGSTGAVSISYDTANGTAADGTDYSAQSGTLAWANGDTTAKSFQIPIIDRHLTTGSVATVALSLSTPTGGAVLGLVSQATLNITQKETLVQPTIALTSPPDGISVVAGSGLFLAANVDDPSGLLSSVQFQIDGVPVGAATAAGPYTFGATVPATPGSHKITAIAIDNLNRQNASTHSVNVVAASPTNAEPTVSIITNLDKRNLAAGSTLTLNASATTADGSPLQEVDFYSDGVIFASFDGAGNPVQHDYPGEHRPVRRDAPAGLADNGVFQASFQLPGTDKIVNLFAAALSTLGISKVSPTVTVHSVLNTDDHAPMVTLTDPVNGAPVMIGTPLSLPFAVSDPDTSGDNAAITRVEYFVNQQEVLAATSKPFPDFAFKPSTPGKYVLSAIATDGGGLAGVSAPVVVNAIGTPTVTVTAGGDGHAVEDGEAGKFVISRSGDASSAITVGYKVKGPAQAGVDYKELSGSVVIPAGSTKAKVKIKPIGGSPDHGTFKVKLVLKPAADGSYDVGSPNKASILLVEEN